MPARTLPRFVLFSLALALALSFRAPASAEPLAGLPQNTLAAIKARLAKAQGNRGDMACVIIDLDSGKSLLDESGASLLAPASNMKVLTSAAALATLGSDFEFVTRVMAQGSVQGGVLQGDLCIVGGGDPNLSGRFYGDDPLALFRDWGNRLKALGITQVSGNLLYDSTLFGGESFNPHWPQDDQFNRWYCAEVSALAFNDNCINVKVTPGEVGQPARIELVPATAYCSVVNETRTTAGKGAALIDLRREKGANVIRVKGNVPAHGQGGFVGEITVADPAAFAATVFRETLEACGVRVTGQSRAHTLGADELPRFRTLIEHRARLVEALKPVNTNSQNLHAEMLLRQLGLAYAGKGTFKTGAAALQDWLVKNQLWDNGMVLADGSGLASANRVTARSLAKTLALMARRSDAELYVASMAVGGESGTLKKRMYDKRLKGRVYAKTGYINGVRALSGYLHGTRHRVAFSILMNGCAEGTGAQDDILALLAEALD